MSIGQTVFAEVDFASQEDSFWSGVVIVAFVILLASCYQCCAYLDLIYAPLPDGHSILDTTIIIDEVFSDIWKLVY